VIAMILLLILAYRMFRAFEDKQFLQLLKLCPLEFGASADNGMKSIWLLCNVED
jgi:hypothetical protein